MKEKNPIATLKSKEKYLGLKKIAKPRKKVTRSKKK